MTMYTYSCMCIKVFDEEYPVVQVSPDSHPHYIAKGHLKLGIFPLPSYRYVCFVIYYCCIFAWNEGYWVWGQDRRDDGKRIKPAQTDRIPVAMQEPVLT